MYGWIWRALPGPSAVRLLLSLLILVAVVVVLFEWVFPAVASRLPLDDGTVGASTGCFIARCAGPYG